MSTGSDLTCLYKYLYGDEDLLSIKIPENQGEIVNQDHINTNDQRKMEITEQKKQVDALDNSFYMFCMMFVSHTFDVSASDDFHNTIKSDAKLFFEKFHMYRIDSCKEHQHIFKVIHSMLEHGAKKLQQSVYVHSEITFENNGHCNNMYSTITQNKSFTKIHIPGLPSIDVNHEDIIPYIYFLRLFYIGDLMCWWHKKWVSSCGFDNINSIDLFRSNRQVYSKWKENVSDTFKLYTKCPPSRFGINEFDWHK